MVIAYEGDRGSGMKFLRATARWAALLAGIASVLFGVYSCYCRIGIYYYTYKFGLGTINLIQEIVDWAMAAGLVVGAMFLYRFYVTFGE